MTKNNILKVGTTINHKFELIDVYECPDCKYRTIEKECKNCENMKKEYHINEAEVGLL